MDLAKKYRPSTVDEIIGQESACAIMKKWIEKKTIPHAILFTGPSGCGKTTGARALCKELGVSKEDLAEMNASDDNGIDAARKIRQRANKYPIAGKKRAFIIDEAHGMTKPAQNAILKTLEEPNDFTYLMICTTEPGKLLRTIVTRCAEIKMKSVSGASIGFLVNSICKMEGGKLDKTVLRRIVEVADGSPRKAIKILESVIGLDSTEKMLDAVESSESREFGISIARCLFDYHKTWKDAAAILKNMEDEPEGVRQIIMSYCTSILINSGASNAKIAKRAAWILNCLREPIYTAPRQLLALSIYEVYQLPQ